MPQANRWSVFLVLVAVSAAWPWARTVRADPKDSPKKATVERVRSKDGTQIAYERSGSGPLVILVSAALSDRSDHARLAELLAPSLSVVRYDRRGRGDSGDTKPYAVQREVEDLEAVIDQVGGSASLFGSSSGAVLALESAQKLGGKVKALALFEPPFVIDDSRPPVPRDFPSTVARLVSEGKRSDAVAYFMTEGVGVPAEMVGQMKRAPMWPAMEKLAHTLEYDGLLMGDTQQGKPLSKTRWAAVTAPVLVIEGEKSPAFLRHAARALAEVLRSSERKTLEGQDHSAVFMAPESLRPMLVEFFAGRTDAPPRDSKDASGTGR